MIYRNISYPARAEYEYFGRKVCFLLFIDREPLNKLLIFSHMTDFCYNLHQHTMFDQNNNSFLLQLRRPHYYLFIRFTRKSILFCEKNLFIFI